MCELLKNLQRQFNPLEVIIKAEKAYKRANDREGELRAMILRINIQSKSDTNSDLLVAYGEVTKILEENMGFELRVRFLILACKLSINLDLIPQNSIQYADELYGYFVVEEPKKHEEDWVACLYLVQYFFEISNYIKTAKVIPMLSTRTEPYIVALIKGYLPKLPKLEIESISPI